MVERLPMVLDWALKGAKAQVEWLHRLLVDDGWPLTPAMLDRITFALEHIENAKQQCLFFIEDGPQPAPKAGSSYQFRVYTRDGRRHFLHRAEQARQFFRSYQLSDITKVMMSQVNFMPVDLDVLQLYAAKPKDLVDV